MAVAARASGVGSEWGRTGQVGVRVGWARSRARRRVEGLPSNYHREVLAVLESAEMSRRKPDPSRIGLHDAQSEKHCRGRVVEQQEEKGTRRMSERTRLPFKTCVSSIEASIRGLPVFQPVVRRGRLDLHAMVPQPHLVRGEV